MPLYRLKDVRLSLIVFRSLICLNQHIRLIILRICHPLTALPILHFLCLILALLAPLLSLFLVRSLSLFLAPLLVQPLSPFLLPPTTPRPPPSEVPRLITRIWSLIPLRFFRKRPCLRARTLRSLALPTFSSLFSSDQTIRSSGTHSTLLLVDSSPRSAFLVSILHCIRCFPTHLVASSCF